jgi:small ligand-binding sensory domain FIST
MKWATALARADHLGEAVAQAIADVRRQLPGEQPTLLAAFASPLLVGGLDLPALLSDEFPQALVVGCTGAGVIGAGAEVEGQLALSLTAAVLPKVQLSPFHLDALQLPDPSGPEAAWHHATGVKPADHPAFLLLGDPFTCDVDALLGGLDRAFPSAVKVGGLASGGRAVGGHRLFLGRESWRSGMVGVALSGDVVVDALVAQGVRPIGQPMLVTRSDGHTILELNQQRPMEVVRELFSQLSAADQALAKGALLIGVEMKSGHVEYSSQELLARQVVGADPSTGAIAIGDELRPFQAVQFLVRDGMSAEQELVGVLRRYHQRATPVGGLLFTCTGRGVQLFGVKDHDTQLFHKELGPLPLGGFFSSGEIGPMGGQTFRHGYASTFALFRPAR